MLLVDFDPQGALSVGLGIQPHDIDSTVYNLLMERGVKAHDVLFKTSIEGMDLLPSNIDLSGAEVQLVHEVGRAVRAGQRAQGCRTGIRLHPDRLPAIARPAHPQRARLCRRVINPLLECEYFAMRGVALLMETIDKVQQRLQPEADH